MKSAVCAHIDCNNFYASCERVFDPSLRRQPIAILSNNDGCIIARSDEAKAAGIQMGAPLFKQRGLIKEKNIVIRSSNYALYGDMSRRVMETLRHLAPRVEPYSIDEAFVELPGQRTNADLAATGHKIRSTVLQWTGLPVSVGIARSKTLAKIASETAKEAPSYRGSLNLADNPALDDILQQTKVSDIWGIGSGLSQRLHREGITNALQLKQQVGRKEWIRSRLNVTGLRTVMELNNQPCLDIENVADPRKGIMTSRSFGTPVTDLHDLQEAVAEFISIAAEKLRAQHSVSTLLHLTLRINKYTTQSRYKYGIDIPLRTPTADTATLIRYSKAAVAKLYKHGLRYKKAAVMLTGIVPESEVQADLFKDQQYSEARHSLMEKMDQINAKYGSQSAHFASTGIKQNWQMKQQYLSPKYTTQWGELMQAKT